MKATEVRAKSDDELQDQLLALKKEAFNLRFQRASGQLENTARVGEVRRDIARVKTVLGSRQPQASLPQASTAKASKAEASKAKAS